MSRLQTQPPSSTTGQLSPDGLYRWDGARWLPTYAPAPQPAVLLPPPGLIAPRASNVSWTVIGGGIACIVAVVLILVGCAVPYASFSDTNGGPSSVSVFNAGFSGGFWYAVEPIAVMFLAVGAAVAAMAWSNRIVRAVLGGSLVAFGIQTLALFAGYTGAAPALGHLEPGGPIGLAGGLVLFAGGLAITTGALTQRAKTAT